MSAQESGPGPGSCASARNPLNSGRDAQDWHPIETALTGAWIRVRHGDVESTALMMVDMAGAVSWVARPPRGQKPIPIETPDAWRRLTLEESR